MVLIAAVPPCIFEIAELSERLSSRLVPAQAGGLERVDTHVQMRPQLLVDLGRDGFGTPAEVPERTAAMLAVAHDGPDQAPCRTASTAREYRRQLAVSSRSRRRPAGVSV